MTTKGQITVQAQNTRGYNKALTLICAKWYSEKALSTQHSKEAGTSESDGAGA